MIEIGSASPGLVLRLLIAPKGTVWIQTFAFEYLNFQNLEMMTGPTVISGVINYLIADLHLLINLLQL